MFVRSQRNLVVSEQRQVALVDVQDLLVVDTADALLISKSGSSQQVKEVVTQLKQAASSLTEVHKRAYQSWGSEELLLDAPSYTVRRFVINPGKKTQERQCTVQSEHWVVVQGTAQVTNGNQVLGLVANQFTCVEQGSTHRFENCEAEDLIMIAIQSRA